MGTDTTIRSIKSDLRRQLIEARRALPPSDRKARSRQILQSCTGLQAFREARVICSFIGFGEEVDTAEFLQSLLLSGRRVAVPTLRAAGEDPRFSEIRSWEELTPNTLGILEPRRESLRLLPTPALPFFLVPGLAFDPVCRRLGYGMGFYDRALAESSPDALLVGLCFDLQIIDEVPVAEHDRSMDLVVTESRVISASLRAGFSEEVF